MVERNDDAPASDPAAVTPEDPDSELPSLAERIRALQKELARG
jgi:hypothetical protein